MVLRQLDIYVYTSKQGNLFAMFGLGAPELLIILVILLLLFGGAKLPQLSRSIGQSLKELRRGVEGDLDDSESPKKLPKKKSS